MMRMPMILLGLGCTLLSLAQFDYSFYAVYDRLLDSETHQLEFGGMDFSGDGNTVAFYGKDKLYGEAFLYTIGSDGSNLQEIVLPEEVDGIKSMCIDSAGQVVYFADVPVVYKAVNGVAQQIFHMGDDGGRWDLYDVKCSGDGRYCFIRPSASYDAGEILRINSDGSGMEVVMHHAEVERDGGYAGGLADFDVNQDGSLIAFLMKGFHGSTGYKNKGELFTKDAAGYHQVTNEGVITSKSYVSLSGDGSTIVFSQKVDDENKIFAIHPDGTGRIPLDDRGFNFSGMDLSYNGSCLLHGRDNGDEGCLVQTDGSWARELFTNDDLGFNWWGSEVRISDDGSRICFLQSAAEDGETVYSLYVGHINQPFAVTSAPLVEEISMNPPSIPAAGDKPVLLEARISDPQGVEDIRDVQCNVLVDGRVELGSVAPVNMDRFPRDDGEEPDATAGDGIFTTDGESRDIVSEFAEVCIRIGVVDHSWTVVVADSVFRVKDATTIQDIRGQVFRVWPNPAPAGSLLQTEAGGEEIHGIGIFAITGTRVFDSGPLLPALRQEIMLSGLHPGLYVLEARCSGGKFRRILQIH